MNEEQKEMFKNALKAQLGEVNDIQVIMQMLEHAYLVGKSS